MAEPPTLNLGAWRQIDGEPGGPVLRLPAHHLVTHGVVVGMTGSGKTGLVTVLAEEALSAGIPTLIIDVKGDLPNLLLAFPDFEPSAYLPGSSRVRQVTARRALRSSPPRWRENARASSKPGQWGLAN